MKLISSISVIGSGWYNASNLVIGWCKLATELDYQAALDYLYSFVDYSLTRNLKFTNFIFNLDRMQALASHLGSPHLSYPIVHIAGTKGKGSTGVLIATALQCAGYKVGLYTSPHMEDFCERIQINRQPISHSDLADLIEKLKPAAASVENVSTFDLTTAGAFLYFAEQKVDIAVVEVGLGGRLDSTNIVTPVVSVITALSMDHINVLGDTLEKISYEKGGIIKPGVPVVVSPQKHEAMEVLRSLAVERNSEFIYTEERYKAVEKKHSLDGQSFTIFESNQPAADVKLNLLGEHQRENAVTAFACLQVLQSKGFHVSKDAIVDGFAQATWPGRFELVWHSPRVILDSAHNLDSAIKLKRTILDYIPAQSIVLVFGASEDKDVQGMFSQLLPLTEHLILTQSIHPRAYQAEKLLELSRKYNCQAEVAIPIESAMDRAFDIAGSEKIILVTGSIFVAAGAQIYLNAKNEARASDI